MSEKQNLCKCANAMAWVNDYIKLSVDLVGDNRKQAIAITALDLALKSVRKAEKDCQIDLTSVKKRLEQTKTDVVNANTKQAEVELAQAELNLTTELVDCAMGRK